MNKALRALRSVLWFPVNFLVSLGVAPVRVATATEVLDRPVRRLLRALS